MFPANAPHGLNDDFPVLDANNIDAELPAISAYLQAH